MDVDELQAKRSAYSFQISEIKYAVWELECRPLVVKTTRRNRVDFSPGIIAALGDEIDRVNREIAAIDVQLEQNDWCRLTLQTETRAVFEEMLHFN